MALIFWAMALSGVSKTKENKMLALIAVAAFVALAGFRLETGYDWIAYESALNDAPSLFDFSITDLPASINQMEPLFILLLSIIKEFGGSIQELYFVVALFNGIVFYKFIRHCRASVILAFSIYFCWSYLIGQMGIMRQSIALSFLMLSLIRFDKSKYPSTVLLLLAGVGFQYSVLMFIPIFCTFTYKKIIRYRMPIMAALLVLYFADFSLFGMIGTAANAIGLSLIVSKLQFYLNIGTFPKSIGAIAYLLLNVFSFLYFAKTIDVQSKVEKALMLSLLLMIFVEALFWQFPLLWNRVQYFVIIAQAILLYKTWGTIKINHRAIQLVATFALSIAALVKMLNNDAAEPYIPYQSVIESIYSTDIGDGRERTERYNYSMEQELP
ncbi:EpsG family protein [Collimonas arenae]|nr:EpsG family protein [Collimonas arenae]